MRSVFIFLSVVLFLTSCRHSLTVLPNSKEDNPNASPNGNAGSNSPSGDCPAFDQAASLGTITSDEILEISGIAASRTHTDIFWVHNDSGDAPRVFALNRDGERVAIYNLEGAGAQDWEDIALGPGPETTQDYLFVGDIGSAGSLPVTIYHFAEPAVQADQAFAETTINDWTRMDLVYPEDADYDAETLFVDPNNGDIYIVTKTGRTSFLFRKPAPHRNGETATLELAATLDLSILDGNRSTTGGDMSVDGSLIVIRTYSHALIWQVPASGNVAEAINANPCLVLELTDEPQGEAIGFTEEGNLVTTSEGGHPPIYLYEQR